MSNEEIKKLLAKYYNAETSEDEELELKEFFNSEDVPAEFQDEKSIFLYYHEIGIIPSPSEDFEQKILAEIEKEEYKDRKSGFRKIILTYSGIAAGILLLAVSYFFLLNESEPRDTFSDPKIAYAETMKILYDVSARLNNGTKTLGTIGMMQEITGESLKTINLPGSIVQEKLKPLNRVQDVLRAVRDMENREESTQK